ncbi:G-PROTEIN-RECEP-F1-2 domain-containing protein [Aphelenchoides bicaudatus]|nr:G-PROTEIN-RECEP-F1-2 domain-containing protein [Aphelenchoides bicaudatus]
MGSVAETMICNEELELFDLSNNRTVQFLEGLMFVSNQYQLIHKYIAIVICVFGIIFNVMHIMVLTRSVMYRSTVNRLLSFVAVCDILTMLSYLIFTIKFSFMIEDPHNPPAGYELKWIFFLLGHVVISIGLHTITLFLSVSTAYIRYKALDKLDSKLLNRNAAGPIFLIVSCIVTLLCVPTFLVHSIIPVEGPNKEILYTVGLAEDVALGCTAFKINLWVTGICFKVVPCLLLIFFTVALLIKMDSTRKRRRLITSGNSVATQKIDSHADRTTKMLIVLLVIFISTELPQGILAIANAVYPNDVHQFIYLSLGDILDLLSLINANVIYIIYPLISTQYRSTLKSMLRCFRETYRSRMPSASRMHADSSRMTDDRDVLL